MSLIEVAPGEVESSSKGIKKEIDSASYKMLLNLAQVTQYSQPLESTIRELSSNLSDAIEEKKIAKAILTGKNKVEDFYINRAGEEYTDSKFDASYYDLNHLSDENICSITYQEKDGVGYCDEATFMDTGVGLSPTRLIKAVGIAFSTKRNTVKLKGGLKCQAQLESNF